VWQRHPSSHIAVAYTVLCYCIAQVKITLEKTWDNFLQNRAVQSFRKRLWQYKMDRHFDQIIKLPSNQFNQYCVLSYWKVSSRSYNQRGRSLSVHVNFGTYNFGTWVFGAVNFGTLNVNFGTCHVRYMTDQLRYMSISVHSATMTDIRSCCVLDSWHSQADLLLLKAYVEERSRRVLFMGPSGVAAIRFSIYVFVPVAWLINENINRLSSTVVAAIQSSISHYDATSLWLFTGRPTQAEGCSRWESVVGLFIR